MAKVVLKIVQTLLLLLIFTALLDIKDSCKELVKVKKQELNRIEWLSTPAADGVRKEAFKQVVRETLGYTDEGEVK